MTAVVRETLARILPFAKTGQRALRVAGQPRVWRLVGVSALGVGVWLWWRKSQSEKISRLMIRIRGEYHEMPGLSLTLAQASRLWQLEPSICRVLIDRLIERGVLYQTPDARFVAMPR